MGILTTAEKENIKQGVLQSYPNDSESQLRLGCALRAGFVVILKALGEQWVEKNVSPKPDSNQSGFMKRGLSQEQERFEYQDRIIMLAEFIESLWDVPNFQQGKLRDLQTKSLEETFFELQIARSLLVRGLLIDFVIPSEIRGKDYDLNAAIENQPIAIEIKCKPGDQAFDDNKLIDPLKHAARRQLPKEGGGVIFLKLSTSWLYEPSFLAHADRLARNFLRNYSRINALLFHWEEWRRMGAMARINCFKAYINEKPKRPVAGIEQLDTSRGLLEYSPITNLPISYI